MEDIYQGMGAMQARQAMELAARPLPPPPLTSPLPATNFSMPLRPGPSSFAAPAAPPPPPPSTHLIRSILVTLGLQTPLRRGAAFAGLAGLTLFLLRPSFCFTKHGALRPWRLLAPDDRNATDFPLVLAVLFGGFFGYALL